MESKKFSQGRGKRRIEFPPLLLRGSTETGKKFLPRGKLARKEKKKKGNESGRENFNLTPRLGDLEG